jgi:hypothetical protein
VEQFQQFLEFKKFSQLMTKNKNEGQKSNDGKENSAPTENKSPFKFKDARLPFSKNDRNCSGKDDRKSGSNPKLAWKVPGEQRDARGRAHAEEGAADSKQPDVLKSIPQNNQRKVEP